MFEPILQALSSSVRTFPTVYMKRVEHGRFNQGTEDLR